jgi:hypothetical protein
LLPLVTGLEQRVADIRRCIEASDADGLQNLLEAGRAFRERVIPAGKP